MALTQLHKNLQKIYHHSLPGNDLIDTVHTVGEVIFSKLEFAVG